VVERKSISNKRQVQTRLYIYIYIYIYIYNMVQYLLKNKTASLTNTETADRYAVVSVIGY
jgi:hypothetical protein